MRNSCQTHFVAHVINSFVSNDCIDAVALDCKSETVARRKHSICTLCILWNGCCRSNYISAYVNWSCNRLYRKHPTTQIPGEPSWLGDSSTTLCESKRVSK